VNTHIARLAALSFLATACTPAPAAVDASTVDASTVDAATTDTSIVDANDSPDAPLDLVVCPAQHDEMLGDLRIVVCDETFAAAPLVHLPADTASGGVDTIYGGIGRASGTVTPAFLGRGVEVAITGEPAWLAGETAMTRPHYAYYLYRAHRQSGQITDVTPIVRVDDPVFSRLLAGLELEGVASRRVSDGMYAVTTPDVPIRIHLDADVTTGIHGTIDNAAATVTSSDGTCLPSLASLGDASPIFGRDDGHVSIGRYPAMHVPFDDVFIFAWSSTDPGGMNMGGGLYVAPAALIQSSAPALTDASNAPHGTPWSGPSATLAVVHGGGAPCTL
jgi:hypothetical protein